MDGLLTREVGPNAFRKFKRLLEKACPGGTCENSPVLEPRRGGLFIAAPAHISIRQTP
jgi:hypothetical protein